MIQSVHLLLLLLAAGLHVEPCSCQVVLGEYPSPTSVATYRPVTASSVCGANGAENYCRYTTDATASLAPNCMSTVCNNTCPFSSSSPPPIQIATLGTLGAGVTTTNGRPGTATGALRFVNSSINVSETLLPIVDGRGFSFAAWINQDEENTGTLISKATPDGLERNYVLTVNQSSITFDYLPSTLDTSSLPPGAQRYRSVLINGLSLHSAFWHHIAVTVYAEDAAFYVNGTVVTVQALEGGMVDERRVVFLGQTIDSVGYYNGLMQEAYLYTQALTAREVTELVTGTLPFAHLSPECHCPPSHPVINPDSGGDCIQHPGGNLVSRGTAQRINSLAHPPGFINDFGTFNGWISAPGDRQVNITLHLTNSLYELIFVNFRYGSPRPKAVVLETSKDGGVTFQPIQYYADDCMLYFGLPDDGQIVNADDANCITTASMQSPTFSADVRTRLLDPQTRRFNLNTSPELREFLLGSHLRLRLVDFFNESTTPLHLYYSVLEVTVAARCACNGHSSRCGTNIDSVCQCVHNTEGDNCERCAPLYNDKPWRYGITSNGFPCKLCDCNGHALSCHYNASIDPFPDSYDIGGGGMCDSCQDNTAGQRCETCRYGYYRPPGRQPNDSSPCVACSCDSRGIVDEGDCVKNEGIGGAIAGQCFCKANVIGQTCNTCEESFFGLSSDNPTGCENCGCNTAGTFDASITCHSQTGQCLCKGNVDGLKCDQCRNGTTGLHALNPLGCSECTCNHTGSVSNNCDPLSGSCECKPGVGGPLCDRCLSGYFGFSDAGCQPCTCHSEGAMSSVCSSATGECTCRDNVIGRSCDSCADGFYNISASCVPCGCNTAGTLGGNDTCDMVIGQCECKSNVDGRTCNTCSAGFTNLSASNPDGCSPCSCFMPNTDTSGIVCDPVTSQCECDASATGLQCGTCRDGFYFTPEGCAPCNCSVQGSASSVCDTMTGQCTCVGGGVGGRVCDRCLPGFFQFPNCTSCGCDPAGAIATTQCNPQTGACQCKRYVTGATCNSCILGFQMLETSNPFGCSAAPDEQAPPTAIPQNSASILLQWSPPEAPNGVILGYNVYRNGSFIANTSILNYTDTGLTPDSTYSYFIEAFNIIGLTTSATIFTRTLEGVPSGIPPPTLLARNSSSVQASWQAPMVTNGIISRYELVMTAIEDQPTEVIVFTGLGFSSTVTDLMPFTVYAFAVRACTSGGCGSSGDSQVQTAQAPPTFQPAPNVTTLSPTTVEVSWYPPPEPNGIVDRYEIFQRNASLGEGFFVDSVPNGTLSLVVGGLRPFTQYEFHVLSYTAGGGTPSEWSQGSTASSVPEGVLPPTLTPLSPFEIQVNWTEPLIPNGIITRYGLYMVSVDMATLPSRFLLLSPSEPGSLVVEQLQPFTQYGFQLEACTIVGCSDSDNVTSFTLESAPIGQDPPTVVNITATSVVLEWDTPTLPNGIITNYSVQRRRPSLSPSPVVRDVGIAFNGNGFATFAPDSVNLGGFRNEISLRFRTFRAGGTIVYYINAARTDYLAIELRLGVPWFFFDAGTGPAAIKPDTDVVFNDGLWHEVTVRQQGESGTITVDGLYMGTGQSIGSDQVISANQVLYIGAIPPNIPHTTISGDLNPNATLDGIDFVGCLFGVTLNGETLDFSTQVNSNPGVGNGCPVDVERGASLLGAGYIVLQENTITDSSFVINYDLRTTHTRGFVFFAHTRDNASLAVELRNSSLYLVTSSATGLRNEILVGSNSFCDGQWHSVSIEQQENQVFLSVDGTRQSLTLPQSNTVFSSRLYIGGAPQNSVAFAIASGSGLDVNTPFSGCIRFTFPNYFVNGTAILPVTDEVQSVRFDGCHNSTESACVPPWVSRDVGQVTSATDEGLNPFTDYLYRISAQNSAGSDVSPWVVTMTEESAPSGIGAPELLTRTSSSLTLTWQRPAVPNGLIVSYDVTAVPVSTIGLVSPLGNITMVTVEVQEPEMVLMATLAGLEPATTHSLYLTAYTAASGGTGPAVAIATLESVPVGVQAPFVTTADSRQLELTWNTPTQPNGIVTRYVLFVNDQLQLSTPNRSAMVDNLEPFTEYSFFLQACTAVGCGNSSTSMGQTLPDRPMGLAAPNLTALSPSSIQATWESPANSNGIILRFELRRLISNLSQSEVIFSGLDFETTISGLTPNTLYRFQLLVFNAGGSATTPIVEERTLEDIPDGITAPDIEVVSSTALRAMWQEPLEPNGDIIRYVLIQNGTDVFTGVALSFLATNLEPFSFYSYSIMACTVRGCGSSNQSSARTLEDVPEGYTNPTISMVTPSSIAVMINPVTNPNGIVQYILYIFGEFAVPTASPGDTVTETRVVYNSSETGAVEIEELLPFSSYEFTLTIVNSAGNLTGEPFTEQTEAAAPMGLSAPVLTLQDNATTLNIQWTPPTQQNGPLQYYQVTLINASSTLVFNVSLDNAFVVGDLRPFTYYEVIVTVVNTVGSADSPTSNITTGETAPSGFDQVVVLERGPRYLLLSWDPPAAANGLLINYTVLQDDTTLVSVPPSVTEYNVSSLLPFMMYSFSVVVCTSAGCVESPSVITMTLEDVPEGVPAPIVLDGIGSTALLSWATPTSPNGVILEYQVERDQSGDDNFTVIGFVAGNSSRVFVDTDTLPFSTYEYRIVAVNGAGSATGPSANFTTREAAPSDVLPPVLTALSSSSINISFLPPLTPNGIITSYTLTRSTPLTPTPTTIPLNTFSLPMTNGYFVYTDTNLLPFTNYTYVLTICTNGGCTGSSPVQETTLEDTPQGINAPTAIVQNSSTISISWVAPTQPNGVIQSYDLLRRDLGFSNSTAGMMVTNCCEEYLSSQAGSGGIVLSEGCNYITQTPSDITTYTDATLQAYSFYQYCIISSNNADSAHSELSPPTQTDPAPMPAAGPQLNASTVNSTSIYLSWGSLDISELLGPLVGYTLYGRVAGTMGLGEVLLSGLDLSYTATGLVASTEYAFVVAVSNGRGSTLGNTATAITEEGIPANLSAPVVDALNSSSLSIAWSEPQQPNGIIIIYTVFLDSVVLHNQSDPGILVVTELTPFTVYTILVEACTQFGCTRSPLVSERTLESAPVGLASPVVQVTGPTSLNISWSGPIQPNGIITNYQLFQRDPNGNTLLIFSNLAFQFLATNLRPFTTYGFEVIAFNSVGNVSSGFTTMRTEETAPSFVDPPVPTVLSANEILLSWSQPAELNGILLGYQIYLGGTVLLTTSLTSYTHTGLEPFTEYSYILEACTNGGCTNSSTSSNTTFEALPDGVSDPVISQLQARSLSLTWQPPTMPNGIITEFILTLTNNNTVLFRELAFSHSITELTPFTSFSFRLQTCNSIGCVPSNVVEVRTPETSPEGLEAPRLRNLTSTSVAIEWSAPRFPNGNITNYILRRGNDSSVETTIVFQGEAFSYNDMGLVADTEYSYTVEAVNGGGSFESSRSYIRTIPDLAEGIQPPNLNVLGPTSIRVSWSPPQSPNGVISRYILYMNNIPVFAGIGFQYTALGLSPFTLNSFYFEVCNQAGCASSVTVSELTAQALPEGVTPPTLNVLGATAIEVSWQPPRVPNGIITMYEIRRRLFNDFLTESIQHRNGPSVLSFPNSGLSPFTTYEYRLRVFNGAGNVFSEWVAERTLEDIPEGVSLPSFADSDIFARNVTATWDPPTGPNGIIVSYRLEYRLPLDPLTNLPGIPITAADVPGNVTAATAVGLLPVTIYEFRVVAINGAGEGEGRFETVTTGEDVPEGLQDIIVVGRTGISLTLTWSPPLTPNGAIREYLLYVDEDLVYRDSPRTYTVRRLQPFTNYTLQLAACTSAGCTLGSMQSTTTAETAPFGQPTPTLTAQSPRTVEVIWNSPAQPNGIITRYDILRQDNGFPSTLVVISSTNDTSRRYLDTTVLPASDYQYAIRAINSAGQTVGAFRAIVTPEAPPEGLTAPVLSVTSSTSVRITWNPPTQSNGIITEYQAFRSGGGMTNVSVYRGQNRVFTDTSLQPFTLYAYTIQACTSGGCSLSPNASATTLEASPADFVAPILEALSATEISLQWNPPQMPNGIITHYLVNILPISITVRTTQLAVNITNLLPFTLYTINIDSCNSIGCATSSGQIRTLESLPQFINAPQLSATDPITIQVSWQEPARPNGVIIRYELRRNSTIRETFNGSVLSFIDTNLVPDSFYSYTIQAYTSVGGGDISASRVIQTPPDTPEDISPPILEVLGANSIHARWSAPGTPNGIIRSYMLEVDGSVFFTGLAFEYTVDSLSPFTVYSFGLVVCTSTCGRSQVVTARTSEAPPMGQAPPQLVANPSTTVSVTWNEPAVLNGVIRYYEVERRQVLEGGVRSRFAVVYNNSFTQFLDTDSQLRPATMYEYRVTAVNGGGRNTSEVSLVVLLDAPPTGVYPPMIENVTSVSLNVLLVPPMVPNGVLTEYRLYQDGIRIRSTAPQSQTSTVIFQVTGLQPFTTYGFHAEVCTAGGCNSSQVVSAQTGEAQPTGLDRAPTAVVLSSRSINVSWVPPSRPNGEIVRYTLWFRLTCPQPEQPNQAVCTTPGPRTLATSNILGTAMFYLFTGSGSDHPTPYSAYQFQIEAANSVGSVTSPYSTSVTTDASTPEPIQTGLQFNSDQTSRLISLSWFGAFNLNSRLIHYIVSRNGISVQQLQGTQVTLTQEPVGIPLEYVITAVTETGRVSLDPIVLQLGDTQVTGPSESPTATTSTVTLPTETTPFYREAAFIVGMVVLGVILLFTGCSIFLCCVRPRGNKGYKVTDPYVPLNTPLTTHTPLTTRTPLTTPTKSGLKHVPPGREHGTDSWTPGDPSWEIPDLEEEHMEPVMVPSARSYSPKKAEAAALLDHEVLEPTLPDTQIKSYTNPQQFIPAREDFGSYRASQTTFADTKV